VYQRLLDRDPEDALGWLGLAGAAQRIGDRPAAEHATDWLRRLPRDGAQAREVRRHLQHFPDVLPPAR
jgi:hypothetical protein